MFRPAVLRAPLRTVHRGAVGNRLAARSASTNAPVVAASQPAATALAPELAPGEQVDPQLNGYPQLPWKPLQHRPPLGWDDLQERRNYGEPVHEQEDVLGVWGPDYHKTSGWKALGGLLIAIGGMAGAAYLIALAAPEAPAVRREYPYDGLIAEQGGYDRANPETNDDDEE